MNRRFFYKGLDVRIRCGGVFQGGGTDGDFVFCTQVWLVVRLSQMTLLPLPLALHLAISIHISSHTNMYACSLCVCVSTSVFFGKLFVCIYVCTHVWMYVRLYLYMYVLLYLCMYVRVIDGSGCGAGEASRNTVVLRVYPRQMVTSIHHARHQRRHEDRLTFFETFFEIFLETFFETLPWVHLAFQLVCRNLYKPTHTSSSVETNSSVERPCLPTPTHLYNQLI